MYYYIDETGAAIPATSEELIALIKSATVKTTTGIWHSDDELRSYVPAGQRNELKSYFVVPPPVPPMVFAAVPTPPPVQTALVSIEKPTEKEDKKEDKKPAAWLLWLQERKIWVGAAVLVLGLSIWFFTRDTDLSFRTSITGSDVENKTQLISRYFRSNYTSARVNSGTSGKVSVTFTNRSENHTFTVNKVRIPVKIRKHRK
jgi:hypothetical protein